MARCAPAHPEAGPDPRTANASDLADAMDSRIDHLWLVVAPVGGFVVPSIVVRRGFEAAGLPAPVGHPLLGMLIAVANEGTPSIGSGHIVCYRQPEKEQDIPQKISAEGECKLRRGVGAGY